MSVEKGDEMKRFISTLMLAMALAVVGTVVLHTVVPVSVEAGCRGDKC